MSTKTTVLWDVIPSTLVGKYWCFRGTYCHHDPVSFPSSYIFPATYQIWLTLSPEMKTECSSKTQCASLQLHSIQCQENTIGKWTILSTEIYVARSRTKNVNNEVESKYSMLWKPRMSSAFLHNQGFCLKCNGVAMTDVAGSGRLLHSWHRICDRQHIVGHSLRDCSWYMLMSRINWWAVSDESVHQASRTEYNWNNSRKKLC